MSPEELRLLLEAIYRQRIRSENRELGESDLDALWDESADLVDALSPDEARKEYESYVGRRPAVAGQVARQAGADSASVLRDMFSADPDSVDAWMARVAPDTASTRPEPARAPRQDGSALNLLEQALVGVQSGARDFVGRNAFGLVRAADNLTGGDIGPLNAVRARTDRAQRTWDDEDEMLTPHLGAAGWTGRIASNLAGEGASYLVGGKALSALSPRYRALFNAGEAGTGARAMGQRAVAGFPINVGQAALDRFGNDQSAASALGWNVGLGAAGDMLGAPAIRRVGQFFGGIGDGVKTLGRSPAPSPPPSTVSPRAPEAPEIERLVEDLLGRSQRPASRPTPSLADFDLRDDLDVFAPIRQRNR